MNAIPVVDAGLTRREVENIGQAAAGSAEEAGLARLPRFRELRDEVLDALRSPVAACVLHNSQFENLSAEQVKPYLAEFAALFGVVSDSNVSSAHSGIFVDEVRPSDPTSKDVTHQLGAIEVHADESSKVRPEDVVALWCARPAERGGATLLWPATDLVDGMLARADGAELVEILRTPSFLFGGKLRKPARLVEAPIFFGADGVRFRMGSLLDATEVSGRPLTEGQQRALRGLLDSTDSVPPHACRLERGDALIWLNRRALHSRTDFTDDARLLYRTRCYNDELSNSDADQATWFTGSEDTA